MSPRSARERFLASARRADALLGEGPARARCGAAVESFLEGVRSWSPSLDRVACFDELEPFAWEGVGLAAALEDAFEATLEGRSERAAPLFVGLGWSRALRGDGMRSPESFSAWRARFGDAPWMLFDGQGYASTLLRRRARSEEPDEPEAATWFDQGVGRALYYVHGGRASALAWAIAGLGRSRAAALWRGVGVASCFTDGLDPPSRAALRERGGAALRVGVQLAERLREGLTPPART